MNGSWEQTDGTYYWPEGLAHYLEKHQVRLPHRFVEHVLRGRAVTPRVASADLERAELYRTWWRGQTWQTGPNQHGTDHYVGELLEMLRQDLAESQRMADDAPSWPALERLGKAGVSVLRTVEEAQRQHEARYGQPDQGPSSNPAQLVARRLRGNQSLDERIDDLPAAHSAEPPI